MTIILNRLLILTCAIFLFTTENAFSQVLEIGQNPPSINWKTINTENFEIIFPETFEKKAQETANALEKIYLYGGSTLQSSPDKFTIILQNQPAIANGFVMLAPRRSEFFVLPPESQDASDWVQTLALHEFRHMVQMDKTKQGFTKIVSKVFGEEATIGLFGITLPPWFYEGDATVIESALSNAGRGRKPDWDILFKAQIVEDGPFNYQKASFGSYKDQISDHYRLGYHIVQFGRKVYSEDLWSNVMDRTAQKPYLPFAFSNALKKETGFKSHKFYEAAMGAQRVQWQQELEVSNATYSEHFPVDSAKAFTNYNKLIPTESNQVMAIKSGIDQIPEIVLISGNGREDKLMNLPYQTNEADFHYSAGSLVWNEVRFDPRWQYRTYSVLMRENLITGQKDQLTKKSKIASPSLSPKADKIVYVNTNEDHTFNLQVVDAYSGDSIISFSNPENYYFQDPIFTDDSTIFTVISNSKGKGIVAYTLGDENPKTILNPIALNIENLFVADGWVYFHSNQNRVSQIFGYNIRNQKVVQLTNSPYGAIEPSVSNDGLTLYYSEFTTKGYKPAFKPLIPEDGVVQTQLEQHTSTDLKIIVKQEKAGNILSFIPETKFEVEKYNELKNLFYFHSVTPYSGNADPTNIQSVGLGLQLKTNNKLSTVGGNLYYVFNPEFFTHTAGGEISYKGFFPILSLSAENKEGFTLNNSPAGLALPGKDRKIATWRESTGMATVTVPLNFTSGVWSRLLNLSTSVRYTERYNLENISNPENFSRIIPPFVQMGASGGSNMRTGKRDLRPRFGQNFSFYYGEIPLSERFSGRAYGVNTLLFFPGLFKHHSLLISPNYQSTTGVFAGFNIINQPRGIVLPTDAQYYSLLTGYEFPIFYPDIALGRIAYIKRVKGGLFLDAAATNYTDLGNEIVTSGFDIKVDMHLLQFFLPEVELGLRIYSSIHDLGYFPGMTYTLNFRY